MATAQQVLDVARGWIGYSEDNGKYKQILDVYNSHKPLARGYKIQPSDQWCDAFVSACAIKAGAVGLIGTEVSCEKHIAIFKEKGIWNEDGKITPKAGDIILYNWDDSTQPNDGNADHIGYVEEVSGGKVTVIEGNKSDAVGRRTVKVGAGNIRGYAQPRYDGHESDPESSQPSSGSVDLGGTDWWGPKFTRELQRQRGTTVDGIISGQPKANAKWFWAVEDSTREFGSGGSDVILSLQQMLSNAGYDPNGLDRKYGKGAISAHQRWLNDKLGAGLEIDGKHGHATNKAMHRALQQGMYR